MNNFIPDLLDPSVFNSEFPHLKDSCYLDHTGTALYAKSQVEAIAKDLVENLYCNPHSNSLPSKLCSDSVDQVRYRLLEYFNTSPDNYSVIFTSGATEALKIVAESFNFSGEDGIVGIKNGGSVSSGELVYLQENHTSVLGMRNVSNIVENNVVTRFLTHAEAFQVFSQSDPKQSTSLNSTLTAHNSLFVYPAQSNFSGLKYPLTWIERVHSGILEDKNKPSKQRWFCLLDAATFVSMNTLDLSSVRPDFVTISFYKMFGLPTGLGALLVLNTSSSVLHKKFYGGGTVQMALSSKNVFVHRTVLHERFEDGTINFLSILSLRHGLDWHRRVGLSPASISLHCYNLARYTHTRLRCLHHANNVPAVHIYADTAYDDPLTQGAIVNFNIYRDNGHCVGCIEVLTLANLHNIHLRTGCFCNPGACQRHLAISDQQYYNNFQAGHVCGDDKDLINGLPTGSVRVSFGPYSRQRDADRLIDMLVECFVTKPPVYKEPDNWESIVHKFKRQFEGHKNPTEEVENEFLDGENQKEQTVVFNGSSSDDDICNRAASGQKTKCSQLDMTSGGLKVSQVCLYPVKSCGCYSVDSWPLDHRGLRYDRYWMVVTETGVALTQKQEPRLCLIKPVVDLQLNTLTLTFTGEESCSIPLSPNEEGEAEGEKEGWLCHSKVCGDAVKGQDCGQEVADWLSRVLSRPGLRLLRQSDSVIRSSKNKGTDGTTLLALSNQAQFLLINENSVQWLTEKLPSDSDCLQDSMVDRFRSNFVIHGNCPAFEEQTWKEVAIGTVNFKVDGPCGRCQMICIDQKTGIRTKEPLVTLSANSNGRLKFGIYLRQNNVSDHVYINVGDPLVPSPS